MPPLPSTTPLFNGTTKVILESIAYPAEEGSVDLCSQETESSPFEAGKPSRDG